MLDISILDDLRLLMHFPGVNELIFRLAGVVNGIPEPEPEPEVTHVVVSNHLPLFLNFKLSGP